jgi:hypothetical protein
MIPRCPDFRWESAWNGRGATNGPKNNYSNQFHISDCHEKLLLISAMLAVLSTAAHAQLNESAVTGPNGSLIMAREHSTVRWTVTGSPSDVIWIHALANNGWLIPYDFTSLGNVRLGYLWDAGKACQLIVEQIENLPNNQIRVSLRYEPTLIRLVNGSLRRQQQIFTNLVGGNVQLRTAGGAIIDSDPVLAAGSVY